MCHNTLDLYLQVEKRKQKRVKYSSNSNVKKFIRTVDCIRIFVAMEILEMKRKI